MVDFGKLWLQSAIGLDVTLALAQTSSPPAFVAPAPLGATFEDAVAINNAVNLGVADLALFPPADQATLLALQADLDAIISDGESNFDGADATALLLGTLDLIDLLTRLPCDGFLGP